jgi:long-chain acyl-CoA synthetase
MELVKAFTRIYDFITLPVYSLFAHDHSPKPGPIQAVRGQDNDTWTRLESDNLPEIYEDYESIAHLVLDSNNKYPDQNVYGFRKLLRKQKTTGNKPPLKLLAPEYTWIKHRELRTRIDRLVGGLIRIGVQPKHRVAIFMETRLEWILLAEALFRMNTTIATLYATLGEEGIIHAINEIECTHIITSNDLLPKLKHLKQKIPLMQKVIVVRDVIDDKPEEIAVNKIDGCNLILMEELECPSSDFDISSIRMPMSQDIAVIMYTSGSTGIPKGVQLTHQNLINTMRSSLESARSVDFSKKKRYLAYLPLAHIFEFLMSQAYMPLGVEVGLGSPYTLITNCPSLLPGCEPDVKVFKPNIMAVVPLVLDRVRKAVDSQLMKKGAFATNLFHFALDYKKGWNESGYRTPLVDKLVVKKVRDQFGGCLEVVICGGAHLSPETQTFAMQTLGAHLMIGYGATETAGVGAITMLGDRVTGTVGPPQPLTHIKLVDWQEGGYLVSDEPHPRGEIWVKSKSISPGYFKRDDETAESFERDPDGCNWFKTGDIGLFLPNGTLRIIDRRKYLVKIPNGEYISPGKIEAELKGCPVVDNICLFADPYKNYTVVLVIPNIAELQSLTGLDEPLEVLCSRKEVTDLVLNQIQRWGEKAQLEKYEIPRRAHLVSETWTPDSGLVTAALKIRRQQVRQVYGKELCRMFSE